jgi:hypothetical protein
MPKGSALHLLDSNVVNIVKVLRLRVMTSKPSEKANMQIPTGLPRKDPLALRTLEAPEVAKRIDCRIL